MFALSRIAAAAAVLSVTGSLGLALLLAGASAPVVAQEAASPSAGSPVDPMAPSFFTGNAPVTGACRIASPTTQVIDAVIQGRGESWGCMTYTTDDPRFSGVSRNVFDTDEYTSAARMATGRTGTIVAGRERIENDAGAWEGTWTGLEVESFNETAGWFAGEGAYDGLAAYVVITDALGSAKVWGFITPNGRLEAPEAVVDR
jgi:hypothetical protein